MQNESDLSRREFVQRGAAVAGIGATAGMPFWSRLALAQGEELVPFSDMEGFTAPPVTPDSVHFLDTRTIDSFYTPNEDFYIVQHYNQPVIAPDDYRLTITGMVENPLEFRLAELMARDKVEIDAGFECGGNNPNGIFNGLIGNARWGGVSLRELLLEAGIREDGIEIVFYGADQGTENVRDSDIEQNFGRSMHYDDALRPEVLVAYEMNGEPLPLYHGAPVRLIVPGWYGVANVKWLNQIHVQDRRYMGRFMARDYVTLSRRDIGGIERWEERSVTKINLKSMIMRVTRTGSDHRITGFVLNDGTPLRSVEIRIDDGPWREAEIDPQSTQYSWKLFNMDWPSPSPGEHTLVSRVTDVNGQLQATEDQMPRKATRWENYQQFPRRVTIAG